jgi:hypothetical protein
MSSCSALPETLGLLDAILLRFLYAADWHGRSSRIQEQSHRPSSQAALVFKLRATAATPLPPHRALPTRAPGADADLETVPGSPRRRN